MPVNHNINVRLFSGKGGTTKTSAKGSVKRSFQKTSESKELTPRQIARTIRAVRTSDFGALGLFGGEGGAMFSSIQEMAKTASKLMDYVLDVNLARSGEKIGIGNIKRGKGYMINPVKYGLDATWGVYLQNLEISRQNQSNDYYRELTGNLIVSKQYGEKR